MIAWLGLHWPRHGLWYDEALTTYVATDSWATLWNWCTRVDIQVPLHYIALRLWVGMVGDSEFTLHLLSSLFVVLAVAATIAAGRRIARRGVGYAAGILLAFAPGLLWIAYEVRAYAFGLALFAWATVFLTAILHHPSRRWLIGVYVLLMLGTLYTHYTAIGAVVTHIAILGIVAMVRRSWPLLRTTLVIVILIGIGFAPWLPILLARSAGDRSYYTGQPISPIHSINVMVGFTLLSRDDIPPAAEPLVIGYLVLMGLGALLNWRQWRAVLVGLLIALGPVMIIAALVYFRPKLAGRYAWPAWIGFELLVGLAIVALTRGRALTAVTLVILVALPWATGNLGHPPESDYREAFAYLCAHGTPDDVILLRDGTLFVAAKYYDHRPPCGAGHPTIGMPDSLITDIDKSLTLPIAQGAMRELIQRQPPNVWVISWQGDTMDPQGLAYGLLEGASEHTLFAQLFGDVRLDRYEHLRLTDNVIADPLGADTPLAVEPVHGGPILKAYHLYSPAAAKAGDWVVLQTWWLRGSSLQPDLRVSAQITTLDGGWTYAQIDQPPAGWKYVDDRWQPGVPALGRYELRIGPDVPIGRVMLRLILYDVGQHWSPIILKMGEITIQQ